MLIKILLVIIVIELALIAWNTRRKSEVSDLNVSKEEFVKSLLNHLKEGVWSFNVGLSLFR